MRSEEEVKEKGDELYERELQKKFDEYLTRRFRNCRFNDILHVTKNGRIGFCHHPKLMKPSEDGYVVVPCNGDDIAKKCKYYECKNTHESVTMEFVEELQNPAICGQKYPKLAILIWALQKIPDTSNRSFTDTLRYCLKSIREVLGFKIGS